MEASSLWLRVDASTGPDMGSPQVAVSAPSLQAVVPERGWNRGPLFKIQVEKAVWCPTERTEPLEGVLRGCSPFIIDRFL